MRNESCANRARQRFTGACRLICRRSKPSPQGDREMRQAVHIKRQTRCGTRFFARSRTLFVSQEHLAVVLRRLRSFLCSGGAFVPLPNRPTKFPHHTLPPPKNKHTPTREPPTT